MHPGCSRAKPTHAFAAVLIPSTAKLFVSTRLSQSESREGAQRQGICSSENSFLAYSVAHFPFGVIPLPCPRPGNFRAGAHSPGAAHSCHHQRRPRPPGAVGRGRRFSPHRRPDCFYQCGKTIHAGLHLEALSRRSCAVGASARISSTTQPSKPPPQSPRKAGSKATWFLLVAATQTSPAEFFRITVAPSGSVLPRSPWKVSRRRSPNAAFG